MKEPLKLEKKFQSEPKFNLFCFVCVWGGVCSFFYLQQLTDKVASRERERKKQINKLAENWTA